MLDDLVKNTLRFQRESSFVLMTSLFLSGRLALQTQSNRTSVALAESEGKSSAPSNSSRCLGGSADSMMSIPVDLVQTLVDSLLRRVEAGAYRGHWKWGAEIPEH